MAVTERRNVIIVGAGASQEFGLPTGFELTKILKSNLWYDVPDVGKRTLRSGDSSLKRALDSYAAKSRSPADRLYGLARKISNNMDIAPSIDNFLDTHRQNDDLVMIGKIAIANAIMQAERSSKLKIDESNSYNRLDFAGLEETWATVFFKIIAAKRDFSSFLKALENITFVSFNYDRCIKQFFANAASSYFDLDNLEVEQVLKAIEVIHPYGSLGELTVVSKRTQDFGLETHPDNILAAASRIRTFTEGVTDENLTQSIESAFTKAELVIFLGFSFIDINMKILRIAGNSQTEVRRVLATAKGRSRDTKTRLATELANKFMRRKATDRVELFDGKCFELFYEYDHYLMSGQPA